jgi:hypothetical protein
MEDKTGKNLRIGAIVLMGMTATMNITGGIGTVCAAFLTRHFPPMWALFDYRWLYQTLMIVTILIGIVNVWSTRSLVRGGLNVHRNALITLAVGTIVAGIQVYASFTLRGKTVPANIKLYTNLLTLIVFLVLGTPSFRDRVNFSGPTGTSTQSTASGLAAIVAGALLLAMPIMVGTSHTFEGNDWIKVLDIPLRVGGWLLTGGGLLKMFGHKLKDAMGSISRDSRVTTH